MAEPRRARVYSAKPCAKRRESFLPTGARAVKCPACQAKFADTPAGRGSRKAALAPRLPGVATPTNEMTYADAETEFLMAVDRYKTANHRPFPTWKEILDIVLALGYRKVA